MLIYKDIISGDEIVSDSFPVTEEENDLFLRVQTAYINRAGLKIDIGANPSAEGMDDEEQVNDMSGDMINDVIDAFNLQETSFDKSSYTTYIKGYLKKIKEKLLESNPERVDGFEKAAKVMIPKILANFSNYNFYTGENMDPEAMVILLAYEDESKPPYALLFKDGLRTVKQ